jgi:hypothetical protein
MMQVLLTFLKLLGNTIFSQANRRRYLFAFLIYIAKNREKNSIIKRNTNTRKQVLFFLVYRNKFKNPTLAAFQPFNSKGALVVGMRVGIK